VASHRRTQSQGIRIAGARISPALGLTTAALTSVVLLAPNAEATPAKPKPSLEAVQKNVDDLYHQAEVATQKYNATRERTTTQRVRVDHLLDDVAKRADKLNTARRELGSFAAAQYRTGGMSDMATLLLADDPQQYFDDNHLMSRLTNEQKSVVDDFEKQQIATAGKRTEASRSLQELTTSQATLRKNKEDVQKKLSSARTLLSTLTAQEKGRLAAAAKKKEEEARLRAQEIARKQAQQQAGTDGDTSSGSRAALAAKAVSFARSQLGKPYVWGATGPGSYDCSGLTQAAWKSAGVSLPRTTWEQVKVGTTVSVDQAQPGDLVFYFSDISHVGIYIGNGNVIDAPRPGKNVETIPMTYMPIYSVVRPA
jgi:cell wall-associated NlpC family hydrolase